MRFVTTYSVLCLLLLLNLNRIFAQGPEIHSPLDIPLFLSGNFGELRSTHFHAGIDLKTNGQIGQPVKAVASGYVSRVKVQDGGYGNALYVTHANGYTSVYGHLDSFYPELKEYVKEQQYRRKTFEIDLYFEKNKFVVTDGMQIGISGNTGRSGGPHLHLEYRDQNQVPQNVLLYHLPIKDTIPPEIRRLFVYENIDPETFQWKDKLPVQVVGSRGNYKINKLLKGANYIGLGIETYDFLNGSSNKCGVFTIQLYVDSALVFKSKIDAVGFYETKYIKSYGDYEEKMVNHRSVHRLFKEPNNRLSVYEKVHQNGLLAMKDSLVHKALIVVEDAYGNTSKLTFQFVQHHEEGFKGSGTAKFSYKQDNIFENDQIKFKVPKGSLYADKWFSYKNDSVPNRVYVSNRYVLGNEYIPFMKYPELSIKYQKKDKSVSNPDKLVVARIKNNGALTSEGGVWNNGWVTAKVTGFGTYALVLDTLSPVIRPQSFRKGWYGTGDILSFHISDDLSGIKTYNGYIDDKWALFQFDAKSGTLFYRVDPQRLTKSKKAHSLKIYVMDERNNVGTFNGTFFY